MATAFHQRGSIRTDIIIQPGTPVHTSFRRIFNNLPLFNIATIACSPSVLKPLYLLKSIFRALDNAEKIVIYDGIHIIMQAQHTGPKAFQNRLTVGPCSLDSLFCYYLILSITRKFLSFFLLFDLIPEGFNMAILGIILVY